MSARDIPCPYCKAKKGQECTRTEWPYEKVFDHPARQREYAGGPRTRWSTAPGPWTIDRKMLATGESIRILDAKGGVVALMKACNGTKESNAQKIIAAVNQPSA